MLFHPISTTTNPWVNGKLGTGFWGCPHETVKTDPHSVPWCEATARNRQLCDVEGPLCRQGRVSEPPCRNVGGRDDRSSIWELLPVLVESSKS